MTLTKRISNYFYRLRNELLEWWWRFDICRSCACGVVLMYHHVTDEPVEAPSTCVCSIKEFVDGLEELKAKGYHFIPIEQLGKAVINGEKKFVVVTFDDVPQSVLTNAIPFLREQLIPFTLFICIDYIHQKDFINEADLKELAADPLCSIGAHTYSHPHLRHSDDLYKELMMSKQYLQSLLGKDVEYIAYPYGTLASVSGNVRRYARRCGYKMAFGTIPAPISKVSIRNIFFLPRMIIKDLHIL